MQTQKIEANLAGLQDSGTLVGLYGCADTGATLTSLTLWANAEYIRGMAVRLFQPALTAPAVHSITVSLAIALE